MSYDQQSSHQQQWLSEPGPEVEILSPADDAKSQRWRLVLGCSSVFLGLMSGFYAYTNISALVRVMDTVARSGGYIPGDAMSRAIAIIAVFCVLALAYVGVGTWNIIAGHSTSKPSLIAAIGLTVAASVLIVLYMTTKSPGGVEYSALGLNALIISRCAIVLRMKKVPASRSLA
ncbi:hypothetical protein [Pseudarthrobacter sp. NIBRBAC000502770]|uniref:hypothetical protein n=1 Tax=Pseudarthrobacter sp. NIBRBAC000502770 TaxID=2590785 RepID=UPI0011408AC7|nr:hypothetical protein [Pseudarthrobacter sp. NIBRBAC000502770]QDG88078.1 hypothetical protein NIBR502770_05960 [Pseudarthrobacter sp. NIBRBAC000502770]